MGLHVSDYEFSHANTIGSALKQPLFTLISNVTISLQGNPHECVAYRVAKLALHCFIAILLIIPASVAWLAGKGICELSHTQIDYAGLNLAPHPIKPLSEADIDPTITVNDLSKRFNSININQQEHPGISSKRELLVKMCTQISAKNPNIYAREPNKRAAFCSEMSLLLRSIASKLQSGEISADKEKNLLIELAEAANVCPPTWLEVATKIWGELNGTTETVEVKLLRRVQQYKEDLTLDFAQNEAGAQWHALNYVRNILGEELGLNTHLNQHDQYAFQTEDAIFGKSLTKWIFMQVYEDTNRFISAVATAINAQDYDPAFHDFLLEIVKENGVQKPEDYIAEHFFDAECKLKGTGVNLMLKAIGILR